VPYKHCLRKKNATIKNTTYRPKPFWQAIDCDCILFQNASHHPSCWWLNRPQTPKSETALPAPFPLSRFASTATACGGLNNLCFYCIHNSADQSKYLFLLFPNFILLRLYIIKVGGENISCFVDPPCYLIDVCNAFLRNKSNEIKKHSSHAGLRRYAPSKRSA